MPKLMLLENWFDVLVISLSSAGVLNFYGSSGEGLRCLRFALHCILGKNLSYNKVYTCQTCVLGLNKVLDFCSYRIRSWREEGMQSNGSKCFPIVKSLNGEWE